MKKKGIGLAGVGRDELLGDIWVAIPGRFGKGRWRSRLVESMTTAKKISNPHGRWSMRTEYAIDISVIRHKKPAPQFGNIVAAVVAAGTGILWSSEKQVGEVSIYTSDEHLPDSRTVLEGRPGIEIAVARR